MILRYVYTGAEKCPLDQPLDLKSASMHNHSEGNNAAEKNLKF